MYKVNRMVVCLVAVAFLVALGAGVASAAEKVGIIDMQKVVFSHPKFADTQKKIADTMRTKQNEAKMAIDAEQDQKKKAEIYRTKRQEMAQEENRLMAPILKDTDMAIRTVAKSKGFTVIFEKSTVIYGGTDITQDVILQLKKVASGS